MSYHPKPPLVKAERIGSCQESCASLEKDLGQMSDFELEEWRAQLVASRDTSTKTAGPVKRDLADFESFSRELDCVTAWRSICEPKMSECAEENMELPCSRLIKEFQAGHNEPLPKHTRNIIYNNAIAVIGDRTQPRVAVVDAQKRVNCLLKYEECLRPLKKE